MVSGYLSLVGTEQGAGLCETGAKNFFLKMGETGCEITCGAPMSLVVKGYRIDDDDDDGAKECYCR